VRPKGTKPTERQTAEGREKRCPRCKQWLPLKLRFFRVLSRNGVVEKWQSYCRACESEWRIARREAADSRPPSQD
jgi:hypothetical protein